MKIKISASFSVIIALLSFGILSSCNTSKKMNRDFIYFQRGLDSLGSVQPKEIVIKANDILSIRVGSRSLNQEQTRVFNMGSADSSVTTYTVNPAGNIEIPMIGALKAAGFTIAQLQTTLTDKLVTYVKDPVVSIRYYNFNVNVLGEVKIPGQKTFRADYVTIIDALSAGGDLTDDAKREDILVIREESGRRNYYKVDLKSGAVFQSPAYQLQPNDVVYVPTSRIKLIRVNQDPTSGRNLATILSLTSIFVSIATSLIYTLSR